MRKLLLFFAMCTSLGTWAQTTATFSELDDGKTLKISANGDLATYSLIDNSKKVFSINAINNVFVDNSGTKQSVGVGDLYNVSSAYYTANKIWSESLFSGAPTNGDYVYDVSTTYFWDAVKVNNAYLYKATKGSTEHVSWIAPEDAYLYPIDGNVSSATTWNIQDGEYIYAVSHEMNSNWEWGYSIGTAVVSGDQANLTSTWVNSIECVNYINVSSQIEVGSFIKDADLPADFALMTLSEAKDKSITINKVNINGPRIEGQFAPDYSNKYQLNWTDYLKYIVSLTPLTEGEIDLSTVSQVSSTTMDEYKCIQYDLAVTDRITSSDIYNSSDLGQINYNSTDYVGIIALNTEKDNSRTYLIGDADVSLLDNNQLQQYLGVTHKFTCNNKPLYVSTNGGSTKTPLESNSEYTYSDGETFYTYTATYNDINNNAAYFAENASYLEVDPVAVPFNQVLAAKIKAGHYTKVQFENTAAPTALTINEEIVTAILYPNGNNSWYNTDVKTLDLGQTTLPGLSPTVFTAGSSGNGYFVNNISVTDLTLPLVPADGGEVIVPANIVSAWSTNDVVAGCEHLTKVRIPEGYTKLADNAFTGLKWVSDFVLPSTLKEIGNSAFENSGAITSIEFNDGLTYIGKRAFIGTNLSYVEFPTSVRKIDQAAFANIKTLNTFKLNQGLEFIGNSAFYANEEELDMPVLDIPSSVKYIGPGAFNFRVYTDMYFHSAQAPICPVGPSVVENSGADVPFIYDICYDGNGGQNTINHPNADDYMHGYANRENYTNGNYWFLMVHFPSSAECPDLDVSSYKDETRVYHKFYGSIYDQKGQVIGVPGHEELYKDYTWSFADTREYVGKETTPLVFEGKTTYVEGGKGYVTSGYEDTYRGLNYIWPSQTQYNRAHTTVALGYNWDGVTKYRPELEPEQIAYMIEDGLVIKDPATGTSVTLTGSTNLTEAQANAYNATLPDAWYVGQPYEWYTAEEAKDANRAKWAGDENYQIGKTALYTNDEVDALNADVEGAVKIDDVQTPATEAVYMTYAEFVAKDGFVYTGDEDKESFYNEAIELIKSGQGWNSKMSVNPLKSPASDAVLYDKESANEHNATVDGATLYDAIKTEITAENRDDILAALEGAVHEGDVKSMREEDDVNAHNATLPNHVSENDSMDNIDLYADYLSMIAFQSTRRCVFAANDGRPGPYPIPITEGGKWWTICMPFNLTKAQVTKYFGNGTHVCLFNKVERQEPDQEKGVSGKIKLYFTDDQYAKAANDNDIVLQAHTAYMIYPTITYKDAVTNAWEIPSGEYEFKTGNPMPTFVSANMEDCESGCTAEGHDHTQYRFVGNYDTKLPMETEHVGTDSEDKITLLDVVVPQYSYIYAVKGTETATNKAQFWFTQSTKIKWLPNKCVVQASARDGGLKDNTNFFGNPANGVKQISIFGDMEDFDDATDIDEVVIIAGNGDDSEVIYNLNGQQLNNAPKSGIYIKNGKKYLAR